MARFSRHQSAQAGMNRSKTRSACDRCHQQKLRCVKAAGESTCERCARLSLECRYSPRERRGARSKPYRMSLMLGPDAWSEPRTLAPAGEPRMPDAQQKKDVAPFLGSVECNSWSSQQGPVIDDNAETLRYMSSYAQSHVQDNIPTTAITCPSRLVESLALNSLNREDDPALHMVPSHRNLTTDIEDGCAFNFIDVQGLDGAYNAGSASVGHFLTSTAGRLTSLNMALYECASKLPSIEPRRGERADRPRTPHNMNMNNNRREATLLALDEVFCATNDFINILQSLYPTAPDQPPARMQHYHGGLNTLSPLPSPSSRIQPPPHLDEATTLLFLSCHCRLADIYESIFRAVQHCIDSSFSLSVSHQIAGVILPQLQVGGFGGVFSPALRVDFTGPALPATTVSMYLALTMTLSSQLWTQIMEAMRKGGGEGGRASCSRISRDLVDTAELSDSTWDMALRRTHRLSRDIEVIQSSL
ncbi:hypothetical protein F5Y08DRAFT_172141 [Xylaria arbuscula]|nr:hypothetical protein F5Y08DRAFT_172141 [Xylaria arbuscula]